MGSYILLLVMALGTFRNWAKDVEGREENCFWERGDLGEKEKEGIYQEREK